MKNWVKSIKVRVIPIKITHIQRSHRIRKQARTTKHVFPSNVHTPVAALKVIQRRDKILRKNMIMIGLISLLSNTHTHTISFMKGHIL